MKSDQVIDAVQTIGIITIAIVLSYVVVRLEGMLNLCADRLKKVLIHQNEIVEATARTGRRIETIEAMLDANRAAIKALSNQFNGGLIRRSLKGHRGAAVTPEKRENTAPFPRRFAAKVCYSSMSGARFDGWPVCSRLRGLIAGAR